MRNQDREADIGNARLRNRDRKAETAKLNPSRNPKTAMLQREAETASRDRTEQSRTQPKMNLKPIKDFHPQLKFANRLANHWYLLMLAA